jgi:hypothetical protein
MPIAGPKAAIGDGDVKELVVFAANRAIDPRRSSR